MLKLSQMGNFEDLFTGMYRDQIVYIAQWLPGDPLPKLELPRRDRRMRRNASPTMRGAVSMRSDTPACITGIWKLVRKC